MTREKIIAEARSWIGTRFHHQGRVKINADSKGGCDCIGLIIGVACALDLKFNGKLLSEVDSKNYSKTPDGTSLKNALDLHFKPTEIDAARGGDVLLMRIDERPQHVALIGNYKDGGLSLIHSFAQARGVVEHACDDYWCSRIVAAYSLLSE
jgi:cell wall-associated NlpC family hydrolase